MKDKAEMTREELIALGWVKKQSTAVEFLEQELDKNFEIRGNSFLFDKILKQAKEMEKEKEEQYNNMLSMLQETYRRLEHTDMISLRKQIKEVLTFKSE